MVSEKKKISNARWDASNMKAIATRLRKETAEEFQKLCEENGESMHAVLKRCVEQYIETHRK